MAKLITHVGQRLWRVDQMWRRVDRRAPTMEVVVTKVGRIWATVAFPADDPPRDRGGVSIEGLSPRAENGFVPQQKYYLSREAVEQEDALNAAWGDFRCFVADRFSAPPYLTPDAIRRAAAIVKGEETA